MAIQIPLVAMLRLLGGGVLLGIGVLLGGTITFPRPAAAGVAATTDGAAYTQPPATTDATPTAPALTTPAQTPAQATPAATSVPPTANTPTRGPPIPPAPITPTPLSTAVLDAPSEVLVEAAEPKYVAPTLRDRIGRIWAPVLINGKGPFRLVLDTGASHSAIISRVADSLGVPSRQSSPILVRGVTGSAVVPAVYVQRMEVGDLLIEPSTLPIVADVFGGAEGVLGREGLPDKRIFADFTRDRLVISHSHRERASAGFSVVPLKVIRGGLLAADVRVGSIRAQAIIDTGAQQTVGNMALRDALMKRPPKDAVSEDIIGVTLDLQRGDTVTAPPIEIGTLNVRHVRVTFADMVLFEHLKLTHEPVLMLGMDVLGSFDILIIDYRMHEMQIRTRTAAR